MMHGAKEVAKIIMFGLSSGIMLMLLLIAITRYEIMQDVKQREWMETKAAEYRMMAREQEYKLSCFKFEFEKQKLNAFLKYYGVDVDE